jgi:glucokinase
VILVGDIGGTHARLSLLAPGGRRVVRREDLDSRKYPTLEDAVREFLGVRPPKVTAACFGVAGPVVEQKWKATNLPWSVDARVMSRRLGIPRVVLINDLVALGLGALTVPPSHLRILGGAGAPKKSGANIAVVAAGTGLGQAALVWNGGGHVACATEGGHADFAPRDDLEVDLFRFLRARFGHVSYERVLSGPGLGNLYDFFVQAKGMHDTPETTERVAAAHDRNAEIARLGLAHESEAAARALDLFASIYGAEAGNFALKTLAVGGVYVAGNIARVLIDIIEAGGFMRAFLDKGRFASLLEKVPVAVVLDSDIGLAGTAAYVCAPSRAPKPKKKTKTRTTKRKKRK